MSLFAVPAKNWTTALPTIIDDCKDGDTILVATEAMKEMAIRALHRLYPDKNVIVLVVPVEE